MFVILIMNEMKGKYMYNLLHVLLHQINNC